MPVFQTREELEAWFEEAAREYLRRLSMEHFMEATEQATQRKITVESLDLVHARRPEVQTFNELLVQFTDPARRRRKPYQVVPDNMVVVCDEEIEASGSYNVDVQPVKPFWVLKYVSKSSARKDYDDNMEKYERLLRVPYYLIFYPDNQELTLYQHNGKKYVTVLPNEQCRYPIPKLDIELALVDGWVRFWFRGKLLPLPGELQQELDEANRRAEAERKRAERERKRADKEHQARVTVEQELERLRAELDALRKQHGDS